MQLTINLSQPFNLDYTLNSGQAFRWRKIEGSWYGMIGSAAVKATQIKDKLRIESDEELGEKTILRYFGLVDDLPRIYESISKDRHIETILKNYQGLRIMRQDPWETIISFITATNINLKRVESSLNKLCQRKGSPKIFNNVLMYTFPTPQAILEIKNDDLREAGFGYRAQWIREAARVVVSEPDLIRSLAEQSYESARALLLSKIFTGVGEKATDCILLFGFNKFESFPIDRWVRQSILYHYAHLFEANLIDNLKLKRSLDGALYNKIRKIMIEYFGRYAGYAQQYLFMHERLSSRFQT